MKKLQIIFTIIFSILIILSLKEVYGYIDATGLELEYSFENNANDTSGNSIHGDVIGSLVYVSGVLGNASSNFSDSNYIKKDVVGTQLNFTDALSICYWITNPVNNTWQNVVSRYSTTNNQRGWMSQLLVAGSDVDTFDITLGAFNGSVLSGTDAYNTSARIGEVYTFICETWNKSINSGNHIIYINGTETTYIRQTPKTDNIADNLTVPFTVGRANYTTGRYIRGKIDELTVWRRKLASSEVSTMYTDYLAGIRPGEASAIGNVSSATVSPANPTANSTLTCVNGTVTGDGVSLVYNWYKNDVSQSINSQTLGSGNLTLYDIWSCSIYASNPSGNSTVRYSNDTGIGYSYQIYQQTPNQTTCNSLFCDNNWSSVELGPDSTEYFNYTKPNGVLSAIWRIRGNSYKNHTIPSNCWSYSTSRIQLSIYIPDGESQSWIFCYDGEEYGIPLANSWSIIDDTQDMYYEGGIFWTIATTLSSRIAFTNNQLLGYCNATSDTTSIYNYNWYVDGMLNSSGNYTVLSANTEENIALVTSGFERGQNWTFECRITTSDYNSSFINSSAYTIPNTAPSVSTVSITPGGTAYTDDLMGTCTASDTNGDGLYYYHTWYVNGVQNRTYNNTPILQENANSTAFTGGWEYCPLGCSLNTSRMIDGDYSTASTPQTPDLVYGYFNYTNDNSLYTGAYWQVKYDANDVTNFKNFTLPNACFNQNTIQTRIYYEQQITNPTDYSLSCYNGTDWYIFESGSYLQAYSDNFYEEAIYWINNRTSDNLTNPSTGNWTYSCYVSDGTNVSSSLNTTLLVENNAPIYISNSTSQENIFTTQNLTFTVVASDENNMTSSACNFEIIKSNQNFGAGIGVAYNYTSSSVSISGQNHTLSYTFAANFFTGGTLIWQNVYCHDVFGNEFSQLINKSMTVSDIGGSGGAPDGGGGTIIISSNQKNCSWEFNEKEIIMYKDDYVKRLLLYNKENTTISPVYFITGDIFRIAGAKSVLEAKSTTELSIVRNNTITNKTETTENLTISSQECKPIIIKIKFINNEEDLSFATVIGNLLKSAVSKLTSNVDIAGFGIGFYWIIIVIIALSALLVSNADASFGAKIGSGFFIVLIAGVLLGSLLPTTEISGKITNEKVLETPSLSVVETASSTVGLNSDFIKSVLTKEIANADFISEGMDIQLWFVSLMMLLIITGIMFLFNKFDWWANLLIGFFSSTIITTILYMVL